jgi:CcmD family protein
LEGLYQFLQNNAIYIVMIIVLIVWTGIFFYLLNLDKRIKRFEKEFKDNKNDFVEEAKLNDKH